MLIDFHSIWHTISWSNLQHKIINMYTSLAYCSLKNSDFWLGGYFGRLVPSTKLLKLLWNVTMKSDQWKLFLLLHTTMMLSWMLVQEMLRLLVPLQWRWHLPAKQCASTLICASDNWDTAAVQHETPKLTSPGLRPPVKSVWMKEKITVISELCWTIIVWKNWIF